MKKFIALLMLTLAFSLTACGQREASRGTDLPSNDETGNEATESLLEKTAEEGSQIPVTLTIGETVLEAYLNDSVPSQSLIEQLPLTVTLIDSDNDFCGGSIDIDYTEEDVTSGYKNGDLAFWTPAQNFVIFVSDEETSENTGNLINLGHITSPSDMLDELEGSIDVTIALQEECSTSAIDSSSAEETASITEEGEETMQIKITVGDTELYATFENNATTQALIQQMPMTLPMSDLYSREMCYRFGANALPADQLRTDGYEIGDIAYWPPRGSLVILYEQNGERFERQHLGHIDSGVDIFKETGDADVTFDVVSE